MGAVQLNSIADSVTRASNDERSLPVRETCATETTLESAEARFLEARVRTQVDERAARMRASFRWRDGVDKFQMAF